VRVAHLRLDFGRSLKGSEIISAMEQAVGSRLVRYSRITKQGRRYYVGCRGKTSQTGDILVSVNGSQTIDPDHNYNALTLVSHPWIESMDKPGAHIYLKTPKGGQVARALQSLGNELKVHLNIG
jgi:hypothetical protein